MTSQGTPESTSSPSSASDGGRPGPGAIVAEKFELTQLVGQGGMGSVWTAKHLSLGIDVALKFIDVDTPELRSRFAHEAQAVARIQSPHVVHVHDFGTDEGGRPYIAMELLRGEELGAKLDREGRLSLTFVERVVAQAAKGLGKAHQAGVVHRDIKPDNIFLVEDDDTFLVKLLDFGIAKIDVLGSAVHHKTTTGSLMGTPLFMSPEQVLGSRKVDSRSDLYSLAVVAYRAITGTVPHDAPALGELIVNISTKPAPPPSDFVELPATVDAFFARALAKEPDARWGTAREMAEAFSAACRGESPSNIPPPSPSRAEMVTPSVEEYARTQQSSPTFAAPPPSASPGSGPTSSAASVSSSKPATSSAPAIVTKEQRPALMSTAHAQTLPNISVPPPAQGKSRLGIAIALLAAAAGIAVAVKMTHKPSVDERLAKVAATDAIPGSASVAPSTSSPGSLGIGGPSASASGSGPSTAHPPTPATATGKVPPAKKKPPTPGKKGATSRSPKPGEAYPL